MRLAKVCSGFAANFAPASCFVSYIQECCSRQKLIKSVSTEHLHVIENLEWQLRMSHNEEQFGTSCFSSPTHMPGDDDHVNKAQATTLACVVKLNLLVPQLEFSTSARGMKLPIAAEKDALEAQKLHAVIQ